MRYLCAAISQSYSYKVGAFSGKVRLHIFVVWQGDQLKAVKRFFYKMLIQVVKSKIHRVSVTQADLNYIGSVTIDENLMEASNILEGERVQIVNINNGERIETYVIKGDRGTGTICLNGPAARRVAVGDKIIIIGYGYMDFEEAKTFKPMLVFPNEETNLID